MLTRRTFTLTGLGLGLGSAAIGGRLSFAHGSDTHKNMSDLDWKALSKTEWKARLSTEQYAVLRKEATERPFSSPLNDEHRKGTFVCAGCEQPLFDSAAKFNSGTGWPSFFRPLADAVETKRDFRLFTPRTEYHCKRCGGHQGHVFKDGPKPTGLRYCNNGVALKFIPA